MKQHTRQAIKGRRQKLRRNLTPAEATLWRVLKKGQLAGRKFRRQHSVGKYILDFYCVEEWLAVELDGQVHRGEAAIVHDYKRKIFLMGEGIKVIRFENYLVFEEIEFVIYHIQNSFGWKERESPGG